MADLPNRELSNKLSSGEITQIKIGGTASTDIVPTIGEVAAGYQDLAGNSEVTKTKYDPQATAPSHLEGQTFYNDNTGTLDVQCKYTDVTLQIGREMHIEVVNNTASPILNGAIVTQSGIDAGIPQVKLAIADTFENARIMGVATHDIGIGEKGLVTTVGEVGGLDTSTTTVGVPLYLSATVAGAYTETAPAIVSRVGGVFIQDALAGKLFVFIINNKNLPSVFGGMQGQTTGNETYSLTTTAQDIINYDTEKEVVVGVDALTGEIILPNDGEYRMHFTAAISFTSLTSTRSVTVELYDVTNTEIHFSYVKNIPRDATEDSLSFSWAIDELTDNVHKMRIKASTTMDVTFNEISFDLESVSIQ